MASSTESVVVSSVPISSVLNIVVGPISSELCDVVVVVSSILTIVPNNNNYLRVYFELHCLYLFLPFLFLLANH